MVKYIQSDGSVIGVEPQTAFAFQCWFPLIQKFSRFREGKFCGKFLQERVFPGNILGFERYLKFFKPREYRAFCRNWYNGVVMNRLIAEVCRNA